MRFGPHHLAIGAVAGLLAACQPSWEFNVPVSQGAGAPLNVQRPSAVRIYAGDTVFSIARRYSLSVRDLIEANGLQPPYTLAPGMVLRLPGGGSDYIVQKGDTLSVLARRFKVDFNTFAATNNKRAPYVLRVGERLTVPGTGTGASPPAAPHAPQVAAAPLATSPPPFPAVMPREPEEAQKTAPSVSATHSQAPAAGSSANLVLAPPPRASSTFLWPIKGEVLAEFGPLPGKGQNNDGINIAAAKGSPVHAAENGVVAYVGNELKGFGNLLLIKHADGWMTAYAHNDKLLVRKGERVRRGQTIATVGNSGSVTSPQLHFEIRKGTEAVDPTEYLKDGSA